jgi:hypothetical protein
VTPEVLDGVDGNPVVQDSLQEGVFAEFTRKLYRYGPTTDDLAHLSWVGMAAPPGEKVTYDDEVRARWAFAARHCAKRIGGVGIEALALAAGLKNCTPCALSSQLETVDEGDSRLWRKRAFKADHPEPVAPMAEVPSTHLLAMEVAYIGICLPVLTGFVAYLPEIRTPCELKQASFGSRSLGLRFNNFRCLR